MQIYDTVKTNSHQADKPKIWQISQSELVTLRYHFWFDYDIDMILMKYRNIGINVY